MYSNHCRRSLFAAVLIAFVCTIASSAFAQTFTFTNATSIVIPTTAGAAATYPSNISVSGFCCSVIKATVTLNNFSHALPDDVGVLLVAPGGQKIRLMTDNGGNTPAAGANLVFDDGAAGQLGDNGGIASGTFKPSLGASGTAGDGNTHAANFAAGAPAGPYSVLLSDLIGTIPNGTWSLYVDDDTNTNGGSISGGWTLKLKIGRTFTNPAVINVPATGTGPAVSSPYPSNITVSGVTGVVTKVTVKLNNFTHTFWDDVDILLVGPGGQKVLLTGDNGGSNNATGDYVFDDSAANPVPDNAVVPPTTYRPSPVGTNNSGSTTMPANFAAPAPASPYAGALSAFNSVDPNGTWNLYVYDDTGADSGTIAGGWSLTIEVLGMTAAPVTISGRVTNAVGTGISGARVTVSGGELQTPRVALTTPFGYYNLTNVPSGATYLIGVEAKRYFFSQPVRVVNVNDTVSDLDFVASP